jgi:predicted RNA-binding protein YlqC (UPF0109 family)
MKELIERMAKALVDSPEEVVVKEIQRHNLTVVELSVAKHNMGKVIGKHGRTAEAIRTIVTAASAKIGKRCVLELLE